MMPDTLQGSPSPGILLEVCVDSVVSALAAGEGGAHRIELCDNLRVGGTTPSIGTVVAARKVLSLPLHVMIRPRGGDFRYDDVELDIMKEDIRRARAEGADGVVFGMLRDDNTIDRERTAALVSLARPMGVTFHRAFDCTPDPFKALDTLIELGIERVLTSGQKRSAEEGREMLAQLVRSAQGRIIVLPGAGITEANIRQIVTETGVRETHVGGAVRFPASHNPANDSLNIFGPRSPLVDPARVRSLLSHLSS